MLVLNGPQLKAQALDAVVRDDGCHTITLLTDLDDGAYVRRILMGSCEVLAKQLPPALVGAFKALAGRIANSIEIGYSQWQQYAACPAQAFTWRLWASWSKPPLATAACVLRVMKAFFGCDKVSGRNAP